MGMYISASDFVLKNTISTYLQLTILVLCGEVLALNMCKVSF